MTGDPLYPQNITISPKRAVEVLMRLAARHSTDREVTEAVMMATRRLSLGGGDVGVVKIVSQPIVPGKSTEVRAHPFETIKPCWLDVKDAMRWRIDDWYLLDRRLSVAELAIGGSFPTLQIGQDARFYVTNLGLEPACFEAELVGHVYRPKRYFAPWRKR